MGLRVVNTKTCGIWCGVMVLTLTFSYGLAAWQQSEQKKMIRSEIKSEITLGTLNTVPPRSHAKTEDEMSMDFWGDGWPCDESGTPYPIVHAILLLQQRIDALENEVKELKGENQCAKRIAGRSA